MPYLVIVVLLSAAVVISVVDLVRFTKAGQAVWALMIVAITSCFIWFWPTLYDGTTFVLWAPVHLNELAASSGKDAVIRHWDAWGFAGMDNDTFLIADRDNRLSTDAGAAKWERRNGGSCQVFDAKRMWPSIFIAITDGCTPTVN